MAAAANVTGYYIWILVGPAQLDLTIGSAEEPTSEGRSLIHFTISGPHTKFCMLGAKVQYKPPEKYRKSPKFALPAGTIV